MANIMRDMAVENIGERKCALIERLIELHTGDVHAAAPRVAGALVRNLAKEGGVFGWTTSTEIAVGLNHAISVAIGRFEPKEDVDTPQMREALDTVALLVSRAPEASDGTARQ